MGSNPTQPTTNRTSVSVSTSCLGTPKPPKPCRLTQSTARTPEDQRLSTHTYRLPIVKERLCEMGPLAFVSSDRLPCRANAGGGVLQRKEIIRRGGKKCNPIRRIREHCRWHVNGSRCARLSARLAHPAKAHAARRGRARLRGSSVAGFGYFHLLCTHSQSAGFALISLSSRRA